MNSTRRTWRRLAFFLLVALSRLVCAQDHNVLFDVSDPGLNLSMTNWGLDTCWPEPNNMRRGLIFMGATNVNIVRVGFLVDAPLVNNDVSASQKATLQNMANIAAMAGSDARWDLNLDSSVDPWYQSGANQVYADRWAAAIDACRRYYKRAFWSVEGFNEPDFLVNNEGSPQNLNDIFGRLRANPGFAGALMEGGSTLDDDVASDWWGAISSRANIGATHCLAGSANSFVSFLQTVAGAGKMPFNPELHNIVEAMIGANYGMKGGIWWGTAELARGEFVKACQGRRLGYVEDLGRWTAASVYRAPGGNVQAFLAGSERMATTTRYRLFSKDRDVYFDGDGPRRDYILTVQGGTGYQVDQPDSERLVNISWGSDVEPLVGGRCIIVNRKSGLALEVAGSSTANGAALAQRTYIRGLNQQWDVNRLPDRFGGDYSYFTLKAAHDGVTVDLNNWSYSNGERIQLWNGGTNTLEQWYFQYAGNGYFKIRSRWSGKCMSVLGGSTNVGAQIVQWDDTGALDQQWRFIPANLSNYDFAPPAAPTGLTAMANALSVRLDWTTNSEADLAGYLVLRSTNSGGPYETIARGLATAGFTDKSANRPQQYYYVVRAIDRSLNPSEDSMEVSARPTIAPSLIAHYAFNGNGADSSPNANHASLFGAPPFAAGRYGPAVNLNGASEYVMAPAGLMASAANFTIAIWAYWNGGGAWQRIFDFGNGTGQYMFLTPSSGSGALRFAITTNGGAGEQILQAPQLAAGKWQHVAVTLSGKTVRLYTNAVLAASGSATISPASFNPAINYFGDSQYEADPGFNGRLDEVFIYNYALSPSELTRLANNQPPPVLSKLSAAVLGGAVQLSWPVESLGARLESNSVSPAAPGDWITVPGSTSTNSIAVTVDPSISNNYFRLTYP